MKLYTDRNGRYSHPYATYQDIAGQKSGYVWRITHESIKAGRAKKIQNEVSSPVKGSFWNMQDMYLRFMVFNSVLPIYVWSGEQPHDRKDITAL